MSRNKFRLLQYLEALPEYLEMGFCSVVPEFSFLCLGVDHLCCHMKECQPIPDQIRETRLRGSRSKKGLDRRSSI